MRYYDSHYSPLAHLVAAADRLREVVLGVGDLEPALRQVEVEAHLGRVHLGLGLGLRLRLGLGLGLGLG